MAHPTKNCFGVDYGKSRIQAGTVCIESIGAESGVYDSLVVWGAWGVGDAYSELSGEFCTAGGAECD